MVETALTSSSVDGACLKFGDKYQKLTSYQGILFYEICGGGGVVMKITVFWNVNAM
jgi:hypothetical protein